MTTHETTQPSEPPTFAEIREILAEVGRKNREIAALMAENEARAYLKSDGAVTTYAERRGLFVIRATASSASILNTADFEPKVFA